MSRAEQVALVAVLVAYAGWRFIRYFRLGIARRPTGGVTPGAGWIAPLPPEPTVDSSQQLISETTVPRSRAGAFMRAGLLWAAANVGLVYILFGLQGVREVPPLLRLVVLVLVNFYLVPFCRRLTAR